RLPLFFVRIPWSLEEELDGHVRPRPRIEQICVLVPRVVGMRTVRALEDKGVVVVALRQIRTGQVNGRRWPRKAGTGAKIEAVPDVPRGLLIEHIQHVQLEPHLLGPDQRELMAYEDVRAR